MVCCACGEIILTVVGDGFVVTLTRERRWMRRRSDLFDCPYCHRRHGMTDLRELVLASPRADAS